MLIYVGTEALSALIKLTVSTHRLGHCTSSVSVIVLVLGTVLMGLISLVPNKFWPCFRGLHGPKSSLVVTTFWRLGAFVPVGTWTVIKIFVILLDILKVVASWCQCRGVLLAFQTR